MAETKHPEEMLEEPSKQEKMRRGRVKIHGPIENTNVEERCRLALMYHKIWKWNKKDSFETAGIGRDQFNTALAQHSKGETTLVVSSGRKAILTEAMLKAVYDELTRRSMDYNSVRKDAGGAYTLAKLVYDEIKKHQSNPFARRLRDVDAHTKQKWVQQLGVVVRAAQKKPKSRQGSLDIRNPMSYAAGLKYLFTDVRASYELFVSSDDVSMMLNPMKGKEAIKVITTKEAIDWLAKHNKVFVVFAQNISSSMFSCIDTSPPPSLLSLYIYCSRCHTQRKLKTSSVCSPSRRQSLTVVS